MAKKLALIFGVIFVIIGITGLLGGMGITRDGMFMTDSVHDWVHIISGIIFLVVAMAATARAALTMIAFGIIYIIVAILGFVGNNPALGFIVVNNADNWLHLVLGLVILWSGYSNKGHATLAAQIQ
jgi:hypothetical protein